MAMKTLELRDGTRMPALGLGTWKSEPEEVYRAVRAAIEIGYRHIDCAAIYQNEEEVGRALTDAFQAGDAKRDEVWITSKLWNDSHAPEHVRPALQTSLRKLELDYLDLYLIHWPVALRHGTELPRGPEDFLSLFEVPLGVDLGGHVEGLGARPCTGGRRVELQQAHDRAGPRRDRSNARSQSDRASSLSAAGRARRRVQGAGRCRHRVFAPGLSGLRCHARPRRRRLAHASTRPSCRSPRPTEPHRAKS